MLANRELACLLCCRISEPSIIAQRRLLTLKAIFKVVHEPLLQPKERISKIDGMTNIIWPTFRY